MFLLLPKKMYMVNVHKLHNTDPLLLIKMQIKIISTDTMGRKRLFTYVNLKANFFKKMSYFLDKQIVNFE